MKRLTSPSSTSRFTCFSLMLWLSGATLLSPTGTIPTIPPTETGYFYYVQPFWGDVITYKGRQVLRAYKFGFQASYGAPDPKFILDFGRQNFDPDGDAGWGVNLVANGDPFITNSDVIIIAEAFMQGYSDNSAHPTAYVGVGTNNSNYPWACDNNDPSSLSANWYAAGESWGKLVKQVHSFSRVIPRSANDIESWTGTFGPWVACGLGAMAWFDGYRNATASLIPNYNFGSQAYHENNVQWTLGQVYIAANGQPAAYAYPQIYCDSYAPPWVDVRDYGIMRFDGVTSDNAQSSITGCQPDTDLTLTWQQSWARLDDALRDAGYPDIVFPVVLSIDYLAP